MDLRNWEFYTTGQALVGASVSLYMASLTVPNPNSPLQTTTTDSNGMWTFTGLTDADYDVKVVYNARSKWYMGLTELGVAALHGALADRAAEGKNRLINGLFPVQQRPSLAATDNSYTLDRWRLLLEAASAGTITRETTDLPTGAKYGCRLTIGATNNDKVGIFQPLEGCRIWDMRGGVASLQFNMKASNVRIGDVRAAIVGWTGTEDAVSADPINVWGAALTLPTYTGSWANANTPAANVPPTAWGTAVKIENISIPAGVTNLAVFIWIDDKTTTAADYLIIADVQLEKGAICTAIDRRRQDIAEEERLCQRFMEAFNAGVNQWTLGVGQATNATDCYVPWIYKVRKRVTPTSFTASGTWAASNISGIVNLSATAAASPPSLTGVDGSIVKFTTAGGMTAGSAVTVASGGVGSGYLEASSEL